jgi:hypothetical protein
MPLEPGDVPSQEGTIYLIDSDEVVIDPPAQRQVPVIRLKCAVLRQTPGQPSEVHADYRSEPIDLLTALAQLPPDKLAELVAPLLKPIAFSIAGVPNG